MDYRFADIHSHALINMRYLRKDLTEKVKPPKFYNPLKNQIDAEKLKEGGYSICVFNIYAPFRIPPWETYMEEFRKQVEIFSRFIEKRSDIFIHAKNADEIDEALSQGKIAALLAIEGGHMVEDLKHLEEIKKAGVFYITLVHFIERKIGTTYLSLRRKRIGLKGFGRELLAEMKRVGIIPDLAHGSDRLMREVLEIYDGPVIFSHTGARTLCPMERNIPDDVAEEIFKRGGLVGIIYCTYYNRRWNLFGDSSLLVETAKYFLSLGGENSVCFGSDMDGYVVTPADLKDVSQTPSLVRKLREAFSEKQVEKITFSNVYRFLKKHFH